MSYKSTKKDRLYCKKYNNKKVICNFLKIVNSESDSWTKRNEITKQLFVI